MNESQIHITVENKKGSFDLITHIIPGRTQKGKFNKSTQDTFEQVLKLIKKGATATIKRSNRFVK